MGELYLDRLYKLPLRRPIARDISRFQPVRRDFSLVLDESIGWEKIDQALAGLQIPELVEWRVREVFRDARLGAGEYSLLMGATFQAADRTLREEELKSGWWKLLARQARGCGLRKCNRLDRRYTCTDTEHLSGGVFNVGVFMGFQGGGRAGTAAP